MQRTLVLFSMMFVLLFSTACSSPEKDSTEGPIDEQEDTKKETTLQSREVEKEDEDALEKESKGVDPSMKQVQNQADMQAVMEELNLREFELEVEYADDREYEVEIEYHRDGEIEAEVEDEINGIEIKDDLEAFNYVLPYMQQLGISKGMDKQQVIDHLLEVFELDPNYKEFEVEIEFLDGTEFEIEDE